MVQQEHTISTSLFIPFELTKIFWNYRTNIIWSGHAIMIKISVKNKFGKWFNSHETDQFWNISKWIRATFSKTFTTVYNMSFWHRCYHLKCKLLSVGIVRVVHGEWSNRLQEYHSIRFVWTLVNVNGIEFLWANLLNSMPFFNFVD